MNEANKIQSLVLDATPLITQSASAILPYAHEFFTTPGVHSEMRDEHSRSQLLLWGDQLKIRHPKQECIDKVTNFSKLTGDYAVLSLNDLHIIALAYELEVEKNGDAKLRKFPGEHKEGDTEKREPRQRRPFVEYVEPEPTVDDDGFEIVKPKKKNKKWSKERKEEKVETVEEKPEVPEKPEEKPEQEVQEESEEKSEEVTEEKKDENESTLTEEFNEEDDDGDWITPDNLHEELLKDSNEVIQESTEQLATVAISTGDFACQNVAMQIGLNLMNTHSGKQIKRVRNYMLRCHACFKLNPIPKDGKPKHFCPKCGGDTLIRCAVSVDKDTGKITPHLKRNFQWITRGQIYSLPSPQSKNQQKLKGNAGYQHNKENRAKELQNPLILREDQKEYSKAVKDEQWQRRKNEKLLQEWIGGGSADNYMSPFTSQQNLRPSGVRVGKGRHANASKKRK